MAVASYDSSFSHKQDALARLGEKASKNSKMLASDMQAFQRSDFMHMVEKINGRTQQMSAARDKARVETDPTFQPSQEDFKLQKTFQFDKSLNYYRLLGITEYATQADVKRAYKELSLIFHPDKSAGRSQEQKEQYAEVFIELKNAYATLSDNRLRRQYDHARDKELASCEVRGTRLQERKLAVEPSAAAAKQKEPKAAAAAPAKTVDISLRVSLEKFAFGGRKTVRRSLRLKDLESEDLGFLEFEEKDRDFLVEIPPGAPEPFEVEFKNQGDEHTYAPPDNLHFVVSSKPHSAVERSGSDLILRQAVRATGEAAYISAETCSIRGRHLLLWGRNPFSAAIAGSVHVEILGEGMDRSGSLRLILSLDGAPARRQSTQCDARLEPLGLSAALPTAPPCTIQAYFDGRGLFAISLTSCACAPRKATGEWEQLKAGLLPLLRATGFLLLAPARAALPRALAQRSHEWRDAGEPRGTPLLLRVLGNEAFTRGDYWTALGLYNRGLEQAEPEQAVLLSNRSACLLRLNERSEALEDARRAAELRPNWPRAWSRVAAAAGVSDEAELALARLVELEPSGPNLDALAACVRQRPNEEAARQARVRGDLAMRAKEWTVAAAAYTCALARGESEALTGRSAALAHMRQWAAAAEDAQLAVEAQPQSARAHCRLGVALLALRQCERAYVAFSEALQKGGGRSARRGREACLVELVCGRSVALEARRAPRCSLGCRRVFACSDVHLDHGKDQWAWLQQIDSTRFQQDVLIVAGGLAVKLPSIIAGLSTLKAKFRRVFYTVGADELRVSQHDCPDSMAKLHAILAACDRLGVDVRLAPVSEQLCIVPLLSWYSPDFDWTDPRPDAQLGVDAACRWPMDSDLQVAKYLLKLNEQGCNVGHCDQVITFSHFLPRRNLPFHTLSAIGMKMAKFQGCEAIDEQLRSLGSVLHVYGRSHIPHAETHDGVMYVNQPLGYPQERLLLHRDEGVLLMQVYDGSSPCMLLWDGVSDREREPAVWW